VGDGRELWHSEVLKKANGAIPVKVAVAGVQRLQLVVKNGANVNGRIHGDDGRSMRRAMEYVAPFIRDKKSWPLKADVMYDSEWPMRQSSLLFAGLAFGRADSLELWKKLPADSRVEEVVRNFFVRQPVLWV